MNGLRVPCLRFSYVNTAYRIRSVEVRSENTPMGRVLLLTSRNLRSMALVVRILDEKEPSLILKKLKSSSSSSITKRTALGYCPLQRSEGLLGLLQARCMVDLLVLYRSLRNPSQACWDSPEEIQKSIHLLPPLSNNPQCHQYHPLHRPSTTPPL